jgi:hypothetical protein
VQDHGEFIAFVEFGTVKTLVIDLQWHCPVFDLDKAETAEEIRIIRE